MLINFYIVEFDHFLPSKAFVYNDNYIFINQWLISKVQAFFHLSLSMILDNKLIVFAFKIFKPILTAAMILSPFIKKHYFL